MSESGDDVFIHLLEAGPSCEKDSVSTGPERRL